EVAAQLLDLIALRGRLGRRALVRPRGSGCCHHGAGGQEPARHAPSKCTHCCPRSHDRTCRCRTPRAQARRGGRLGTSDGRRVQAEGGPREGTLRGAASSGTVTGTGTTSSSATQSSGSENVTVTTPVVRSRSRQALQWVSSAQPSSEWTKEASD